MTMVFESAGCYDMRTAVDPELAHAEIMGCLHGCTESNDSKAAFLGYARQVFAAPLLPHPGYATRGKQGAHANVLVLVRDQRDSLDPDGAVYDAAMHYLNADGSEYAPPDTARFSADAPEGYDPEVADVLRAAVCDVWQRGWFDFAQASLVAAQIERAENDTKLVPRIPLPVVVENNSVFRRA